MKFSVIIPVFGTEHLLPRCLDSLVAQTDGDFEAIVVDDGSPGAEGEGRSAEEIVSRYDGRFRHVRHERNMSLLQARLTGLRLAKGEFVIPFDSDDYAAPGLVAALKAEVARCPDVDLIAYQRMTVESGRRPRPELRYRNRRLDGREALDLLFAGQLQCAIGGKAVRRTVYAEMADRLGVGQDFYLNSSEDLCQTVPLLALSKKVSVIDFPGYLYWTNPESLTNTLTDPVRMGKATENTSRVFALLDRFAAGCGDGGWLASRLDRHRLRTLEWYLGCVLYEPPDKWCACVSEICRFFDPALVARAAMELIMRTRTYRVGRAVTALPQAVRKLLKGASA